LHTKTLSIITVNKNNADGLEKTIQSVICQTYSDFEYIIIDGASDDNSAEIIKKYADKINFWISEPDTGVYNAMNKGIQKAQGEYCLFLNSGDHLLYPWTIQDLDKELKTITYADVYYSDAVTSSYKIFRYPKKITKSFFLFNTLNHQNCLIRRDLFKDNFYDENFKIISDFYFFINGIYHKNMTFFHLETKIAMYDTNGISKNLKERVRIEMKMVSKKTGIPCLNTLSSFAKIFKIILYLFPYGLHILIYSKSKKSSYS